MKLPFSHLSAKTNLNYQESEANAGLTLKQQGNPLVHSVAMVLDGIITTWLLTKQPKGEAATY